MLRLAGVHLHPGVRVLIGAGIVALGLANGGVSPMMLIGCALVVWGLVAVASVRRSRSPRSPSST
jgi:hypothetical protein